jgi:hypothetical protein
VNNFDGAKQFLNSKFKVVNMEDGFPQARATTLTLADDPQNKQDNQHTIEEEVEESGNLDNKLQELKQDISCVTDQKLE